MARSRGQAKSAKTRQHEPEAQTSEQLVDVDVDVEEAPVIIAVDEGLASADLEEENVSDVSKAKMRRSPPKSTDSWNDDGDQESESDDDLGFPARAYGPKGIYNVMAQGVLSRPSFLGHPRALEGITTKSDRRGSIEFMRGRDVAEWIVFGELAGQYEGCQMSAMGDRATRKPASGVSLLLSRPTPT